MNHNFNYALFNNFYQDPRSAYVNYPQHFDSSYPEEHDHSDYTFLPKTTTFFENFVSSPLDVTRQSTDVTEGAEITPLTQKQVSPFALGGQKYNIQEYNSNFGNLAVKSMDLAQKAKFNPMMPTNQELIYNGYNNNMEPKTFPDQVYHPQVPTRVFPAVSRKIEENFDKMQKIEHVEEDQEMDDSASQEQDPVVNAQLRTLTDTGIWCEEKDQTLLKLGTQYKCDWKKISKRFNNKKITPHFLKIRYKELTCAPLQRRVKFNHKEDLMIAKYFEKYGSNWAQMSGHFNNRTAIMLKNRYYSFIRKRELLDSLLQEVREIEKDNREVDQLKDQDSETYYETIPGQKEASPEDNQNQFLTNNGMGMENIIQAQMYEKMASALNLQKQAVFGHEGVKMEANMIKEVSKFDSEAKEIEFLKARVKSLQSLYITTKHELDRIKAKQ